MVNLTMELNVSSVENNEAFDFSVVQLMCFPVISALGLIGNSVICLAVYKRSRLRIIDYFILNLAITDLATCIVSLPFDFVEILSGQWLFGPFLCKIVYPLQTILISVSVYTLLCMSLERRRAIIRPFKPRIKSRRVLIVIGLLWVLSLSLVGPYIDVLDIDSTNSSTYCLEHWPNVSHAKAFTLSLFVVLYLLPLIVIVSNYVTISTKLWKDIQRVRKAIGEPTIHSKKPRVKARSHRNMRIVKIFILVVIVFAVCMAPNHIMWIWHDYGDGIQYKHFSTLLVFSNILMYSNSAINPFIFVFLHSQYCKDLIRICNCPFERICRTRPKPRRRLRKPNKNTHFHMGRNLKLRRKPNATIYERNFGLLCAPHFNNELFKERILYRGLGADEGRPHSWKTFCRLQPNGQLLEPPPPAEGNIPKRKIKVNFGGERIIHIDRDNNIEMESAI